MKKSFENLTIATEKHLFSQKTVPKPDANAARARKSTARFAMHGKSTGTVDHPGLQAPFEKKLSMFYSLIEIVWRDADIWYKSTLLSSAC